MEKNGCHLEGDVAYCLCRKPYDDSQFMIECDICNEWFHGSCVGVPENQAGLIEEYHCPSCQKAHGPLILKHRPQTDYYLCRHGAERMTDDFGKTAVQSGSEEFIKRLLQRTFPDASNIPLVELRGYELTFEYLAEHGFERPILVRCKDGLDLRVPHDSFSVQDVEDHVGSLKELDVIDVARQEDFQMLMREWTQYFTSAHRQRILNVISLEFTGTKLADIVHPPRVVHELSWVDHHWPSDVPVEDLQFVRPEVQRYCLMGAGNSYTDFHVDFGGSSVWYHILRGEKIFYLIPPTRKNILKYERWLISPTKAETFLADQVDVCYKCSIKAGETVFLPSGWIHAVYTPVDSIVFGGNFLHSLSVRRQIDVYKMELRTNTPKKYLFPNFETLHWFFFRHVYEIMRDCREDDERIPAYLLRDVEYLHDTLRDWTSESDLSNGFSLKVIPDTIRYRRLLQDFLKELQFALGRSKKCKTGQKRRRSVSAEKYQEQHKSNKSF